MNTYPRTIILFLSKYGLNLMFDFNLPYADEIAKILNDFKIINWEAKLFWQKIETKNLILKRDLQKEVYQSLRILSKHGYLDYQRASYNPSIFLYSETELLRTKRDHQRKVTSIAHLEDELNNLNKDLTQLRIQISFISELIKKYPLLNNHLFRIKNDFKIKYNICRIKINTLETIILRK